VTETESGLLQEASLRQNDMVVQLIVASRRVTTFFGILSAHHSVPEAMDAVTSGPLQEQTTNTARGQLENLHWRPVPKI
jgi:hypothetical protein